MSRRLWPLLLVLAPALAACDLFACANRTMLRVDAPGGRHAAALFVRSCGTTTGLSAQVSLVRRGERSDGPGNIFIPAGEGRMPLVEWLGPDRLLITYQEHSPPFLAVRARDGVRIDYRAIGAP